MDNEWKDFDIINGKNWTLRIRRHSTGGSMKDKCEWKEGEFYPCSEYKNDATFRMRKDGWTENYDNDTSFLFSFCPFCGADIRKPEPEVIEKEVDIKVKIKKKPGSDVAELSLIHDGKTISIENTDRGNFWLIVQEFRDLCFRAMNDLDGDRSLLGD